MKTGRGFFTGIVLFLLCAAVCTGCAQKRAANTTGEPANQGSSAQPVSDSGEQKTTHSQTRSASVDSSSYTKAPLTPNGKTVEKLKTPEKMKMVLEFRRAMGREPTQLSTAQTKRLLSKINALQLKGYVLEKEKIDRPAGGGTRVELEYKDTSVTFVFTAKEIISVQYGEEEESYFQDVSGNYDALAQVLVELAPLCY